MGNASSVSEDGCCPADGCHWVVVECTCEDSVAEYGERGHLICLGCGQDADQLIDNPSGPCDCGPDDQPDPEDEGSYRADPGRR